MYRHLASKAVLFELEVSVDETETPTTPQEHVYITSELKRLGIRWVSLAPRYVGRFEKGIDYIGGLDARCPDEALAGLLDEVQTRQVVHVTFGSVLATFGSELKAVLQAHQHVYERVLDRHFYRHLLPFAEASKK